MKNRWPRGLVLLLFVAFSLSGCGGCDDVSGSITDDVDLRSIDAGADDADVGELRDVGEQGDAGDQEGTECTQEGALRACGTNVGECEYGEQECVGGEWGPCEGGVGPQPENCTGLDESCTGVADDHPDEELCPDVSPCFGGGQCLDGACF